jgi:hypothetical protein
MAPHLPSKTLKQIRDKRSETNYKRRRDKVLAAAQLGAMTQPQFENNLAVAMEPTESNNPTTDLEIHTRIATINRPQSRIKSASPLI